jgi:hypothetical protein
MIPSKGDEVYPLSNTTLNQLADAIRARHPNKIEIIVAYPFRPATNLTPNPKPTAITVPLSAATPGPYVGLGFGVVFAMTDADDDSEDDDGLLGQTGFQLDLIGSHQLLGPRNNNKPLSGFFGNDIYAQVRLGLNSDQRLNVVTSQTNVENPASDQFETAIGQADQVALTGQLEFVWPLKGQPVEVSIVPEYGVAWTQLEPFAFPALPRVLGGDPEPSEGFFDEDIRRPVVRALNQTLPLGAGGVSAVFRFRRSDRLSFYVGGGPLWKETVERGIRYQRRPPNQEIARTILSPVISTPVSKFWRAQFGARMAGTVDLRVDAVGPLSRDIVPGESNRKSFPPILRLVLVRNFPITR